MPVRKRFGQHFLHDPAIIRRIVEAVAPAPGERLVEIGPGRGALTFGLLARAKTMDVIEIDRDLAAALRAEPRARDHLNIHVGNVLETDFIGLNVVACFKVIDRSSDVFSPHDYVIFIKNSFFLCIRIKIVMSLMRSFIKWINKRSSAFKNEIGTAYTGLWIKFFGKNITGAREKKNCLIGLLKIFREV